MAASPSFPFFLLAVLLLAGCAQSPANPLPDASPALPATPGTTGLFHLAGGVAVAAPAGALAALGGSYHTGFAAFEPTLGVDAKGTLYMTAFKPTDLLVNEAPTVVRSTDRGQTWKDVGPLLPDGKDAHPTTFDPYVHVDPATGRVYMDDLLPLSCSFLSWSDDQGATWTTNPYACGHSNLNDHQSVGTAKPRLATTLYPNVLYFCANNVYDTACTTSLDGGLTFGPQRVVYPGRAVPAEGTPCSTADLQRCECGGLAGQVAAGPDGKAYLPKGHCGLATVAVSADDGLTWAIHTIDALHPMSREQHDVSIAVDEANTVHALWPAADGFLYYSRSGDGGATWSPALNVTAPGVTATTFNAVAAGAPGKVAFAYVGTTVPGGYGGKGDPSAPFGEDPERGWQNATWNAYLGILTDAAGDAPALQTVTANDPRDPLARGLCGGTRCNGMGDFIGLVLDGEGRPWASFVDVCTRECVTDPAVLSDTPVGLVATLREGPALRGAGALAPLPPQAAPPA